MVFYPYPFVLLRNCAENSRYWCVIFNSKLLLFLCPIKKSLAQNWLANVVVSHRRYDTSSIAPTHGIVLENSLFFLMSTREGTAGLQGCAYLCLHSRRISPWSPPRECCPSVTCGWEKGMKWHSKWVTALTWKSHALLRTHNRWGKPLFRRIHLKNASDKRIL